MDAARDPGPLLRHHPGHGRRLPALAAAEIVLKILVATDSGLLAFDVLEGGARQAVGLGRRRPSCLAADPWVAGRAWCGTTEGGVFRSDDAGLTWHAVGLAGRHVTAVTPSPAERDVVWAGTEPSAVWRSGDGGASWERSPGLVELPSSSEWAFPPRPDTHHVRWIACHPARPGRLWVAIEAGALVTTSDGGRSWKDRAPDGPRDTHELAVHPQMPEMLRAAAGDGYFESGDGGESWATPQRGLEARYLRSVAIDPGAPDVVVVSAASGARSAYVAGRSDGRLYRRTGTGRWERVVDAWPEAPETIAPLLAAGDGPGELWATDERGLHRSGDGGQRWERVATFPAPPSHLRGLAPLGPTPDSAGAGL